MAFGGMDAPGTRQPEDTAADESTDILKVSRQIRNPNPSIDAYLLEEHSGQFQPDSI